MSWHTKQSAHNVDAQQHLSESGQHIDWEITALFYSVIHAIDGYLSSIDASPQNHTERKMLVRRELRRIYKQYCAFYTLCIKVRYTSPFDSITQEEKQAAVDLHNAIRASVPKM